MSVFEHLIINDSYRTLTSKEDKQDAINKGRPSFAATPGHSKHGWGMAVDLGGIGEFGSERYQWLKENAIKYCLCIPPASLKAEQHSQSRGTGEYWVINGWLKPRGQNLVDVARLTEHLL